MKVHHTSTGSNHHNSSSTNWRSCKQQQQRRRPMPIGAPFWRRFAARLHVFCLGELRHALMAHSCVGVPGAISLLGNLCVTSDFKAEGLDKVRCRVRTPMCACPFCFVCVPAVVIFCWATCV
eukprot:GHRQ01025953.1.p2 GENE.GHRQ01025953.1~~GHRQ01025953.1.p2  ORF type:complete len:132 (+),score=46.72 GHRQ01025953.1:32-397(+)